MIYDVEVQHGTSRAVVAVVAEDAEEAIAKARRVTRDIRTLPMAYEHFRIVAERES